MINLKTHKEKLAEWHLQNRLRRNWETKLANQIKIEVNRTAKIIANDYAISGRQSMGNAQREHFNRLKSISHWR